MTEAVSRYTIGDRVIYADGDATIREGTVQSITFDADGVFYDIELDDSARTVVQRVRSNDVEPAPT